MTLCDIIHQLQVAKASNKRMMGTSLDIQAAFDSIDHLVLIMKLIS